MPRLFWLLLLACAASVATEIPSTHDLSKFFGEHSGCFVLYDSQDGRFLRYNPKACAERFSPCSTFKIPHTVIALDTGVASGPDFFMAWDGTKHGVEAWDRDQTLQSAFKNSVVWYYQALAQRIGEQREAEFVRKCGYGNMDITGGLTNFWLQSSLLISADEQIAFLRRLWANELPASREAQRLTREMMELSRRNDRILFGKTGTGGNRDAGIASLGWFVGCVVHGDRTDFFATRIVGNRNASGRIAREISESILEDLGI